MYLALLPKDGLFLFYYRLQLILSNYGIIVEIALLLIFECFLALTVRLKPMKFVRAMGLVSRAETARV